MRNLENTIVCIRKIANSRYYTTFGGLLLRVIRFIFKF